VIDWRITFDFCLIGKFLQSLGQFPPLESEYLGLAVPVTKPTVSKNGRDQSRGTPYHRPNESH